MFIVDAGNRLTGVIGGFGPSESTKDESLLLLICGTDAPGAGRSSNLNGVVGAELPEGAGIRRKGMLG